MRSRRVGRVMPSRLTYTAIYVRTLANFLVDAALGADRTDDRLLARL
jgi:hypothetical protein